MSDPPVTVRPIRTDDLERVVRIESGVFGRPPRPDAWRRYLDDPVHLCLVAERGREVAGMILLAVAAGEASLNQFAVKAGCRGQGIGARLLAAAIDAVRRRGGREMFLEVRAQNGAARRLYERHGFAAGGARPGYYTAPKDDALIFRLAL